MKTGTSMTSAMTSLLKVESSGTGPQNNGLRLQNGVAESIKMEFDMNLANRHQKRHHLIRTNCALDINELIYRFVKDGWIADPRSVDLISFSKSDIEMEDFDISGEETDYHLLSWRRNFPSRRKSICTEFKLCFYADGLQTNGIGIFDKFRLTTFLNYLMMRSTGDDFSFDIHMNKGLNEGAILFHNGVLIQFSSENGTQNFYLKTVESNMDLLDIDYSKSAHQRFVKFMFNKFSCEELNKEKYLKHRAIQKLCVRYARQRGDLAHHARVPR